jgi:hypothetical protein
LISPPNSIGFAVSRRGTLKTGMRTHAMEALEESAFLLTIAWPGRVAAHTAAG